MNKLFKIFLTLALLSFGFGSALALDEVKSAEVPDGEVKCSQIGDASRYSVAEREALAVKEAEALKAASQK